MSEPQLPPFFRPLRERLPDVDIVVLPPPAPRAEPVPLPAPADEVARRTAAWVRELWDGFGAPEPSTTTVRWTPGGSRGAVALEVLLVATPVDTTAALAVLVAAADSLRVPGALAWHVLTPPTGLARVQASAETAGVRYAADLVHVPARDRLFLRLTVGDHEVGPETAASLAATPDAREGVRGE
ncbi:hypothetical protein [Nocardioides zeae]|uniref:Uncharacterized protein n=1 Tax=Nocardioides zeae TaxID=1457234 RepID=A0AAJ1U214_9ACTN|nr:hypothetical protein [Nocardioides zeae]MDQ1106525.1 hypothetical protein [Nocardioides zeae]